MKAPIALALNLAVALFAAGGPAQAKLTPVETSTIAPIYDFASINSGPAAREQAYFQAPQTSRAGSQDFPCRTQLRLFAKTRIAQSCD